MKLAQDFRRSAREALRGRWGMAVVAGIIASLLGVTGSSANFEIEVENNKVSFGGFSGLAGTWREGWEEISNVFENLNPIIWAGIITGLIISLAVGIAMFVVTSVVEVGYANFNTHLIDNDNPRIGNLFDFFRGWKAISVANLLRCIYCFLWSLLFVIPGIIAVLRYSMVPYILADNPELSASEALRMSKEMMRGNKGRFFCLGLSFIGWIILGALSFGIGFLWIDPYIHAAQADFYREISGTRPVIEIIPEIEPTQIDA